jgi:hypothetical protein
LEAFHLFPCFADCEQVCDLAGEQFFGRLELCLTQIRTDGVVEADQILGNLPAALKVQGGLKKADDVECVINAFRSQILDDLLVEQDDEAKGGGATGVGLAVCDTGIHGR